MAHGWSTARTLAAVAQLVVDAREWRRRIPISYGDFDHTNVRWSPDGTKIAFISNFTGSTAIETIEIPGVRFPR